MTGVELSEEILKVKPEISVVLCTGFSESISKEKAKAIGIREFVVKPLNQKDIALIIHKVLDK